MAKRKNENGAESPNEFRFNLTGLIVFCVCLTAGALFLGAKLFGTRQNNAAAPSREMPAPGEMDKFTFTRKGPWGELLTQDISLERPVEYLNVELKTVPPPVWTFHGMNVAQVKALFVANGLTQEETEKALAPDHVSIQGTDTLFKPSEQFVLSLRPEIRARLYVALRGLDVSPYLDWPYYYPKDSIKSVFADARLHPDDLALLKKLVYDGDGAWRLSDFETLMGRIPTMERRIATTTALSRQPAVLVGIRVRPDTDADKVAQYWGNVPNVRFIDIRPMIEALKRLPNGGGLSLMYVLPPFARDHLYTYPLPPKPGEPTPDSQWSTFNFSNLKPDNRFLDHAECTRYIDQHLYKIAQPSLYGDVVVFKDPANRITHSAVYLADDLVFTKGGKDYAMPWVVTRVPDLQAMFPTCTISYFRNKVD
jgi:hypothetical protein